MAAHGMEASIGDDVRPEHEGSYPVERFAELAEAVTGYIVARRAEWVAAFGPEQAKATTAQAHERFVLSRCHPAVKRPA